VKEREMLSDLHLRVVEAVRAGIPTTEIEAGIIEPALVEEDEKAARWLYAEALRELGDRERQPVLLGS
jgi:hypothetical protein